MSARKTSLTARIRDAKNLQQQMYNRFHGIDWDVFKENELKYLRKKIYYLLIPQSMEKDDATDITSPEVEKLYNMIVQEGTHKKRTYMSFIFIHGLCDEEDSDSKDKQNVKKEDSDKKDNGEDFLWWPVFRVPKNTSTWDPVFIDLECRVYKNWADFQNNNQLPSCIYCYPSGGKYDSTSDHLVSVGYSFSPAHSLSRKALHVADVASTGVGLGCAAVAIGSMMTLPIAAPVLLGTTVAGVLTSLYSGARAGAHLVDRSTHKQSIALRDPDARGSWLAVVGSAVGSAAMGATTNMVRLARAGQTVGKTTTTVVTALNATSLAMGGIGAIHGFFTLRDKYNDDNLTTIDVFLFSSQLLLFYNASVNFQTAHTIVSNTQDQAIQDFKASLRSNRHRNAFTRLEKSTVSELGSVQGRAQVIRSINHIDNKDDFMASIVRTGKNVKYTRSKIIFADGGQVLVNKKLFMRPEQLSQANKQQRIAVLRASQRYANNRLSQANFRKITEGILGNGSVETRNFSRSYQSFNFNSFFQKKSVEKHELSTLATLLSTMEMKELEEFLSYFDADYHDIILRVSHKVFHSLELKLGSEFKLITFIVMDVLVYFLAEIFSAHCRLAAELLRHYVPKVPLKYMTKGEFCKAFLLHILENPELIHQVFFQITNFITLLVSSYCFPQQIIIEKNLLIRDFVPVIGILLRTNESVQNKIIQLAIECFNILGLRNISSLIQIVRELWLFVQDVIEDMSEKHDHLSNSDPINLSSLCDDTERIVDMMRTDAVTQNLVMDRLQQNIDQIDDNDDDNDSEDEDEGNKDENRDTGSEDKDDDLLYP